MRNNIHFSKIIVCDMLNCNTAIFRGQMTTNHSYNKKAFQSTSNRPLSSGYIINKFEHVRWRGGAKVCAVRSKLNKSEHVGGGRVL